MHYKIVAGTSIEELERTVAQKIREGWTPLGGVTVETTHYSHGSHVVEGPTTSSTFLQAMTK